MIVTGGVANPPEVATQPLRGKVLAYDEDGRPVHIAIVYDDDTVIHDEIKVAVERK